MSFTLAIFLNAFLLFLLEPLFGKLVLPHLGGTAAVWTTCMLFFQIALVAGYLYSHALASLVRVRAQVAIHLGLLAVTALTLPASIPRNWSPADIARPELSLIGLMARRIGLPFLLLAAGSPLIQHWFSRSPNAHERDPYRLYVASNLGSFAALLAYPFVIEPWMTLSTQARRWTMGYVALIGLMAICGFVASRGGERAPPRITTPQEISWTDRFWWLALAAIPSSLFLGVTTHITTDLAPVPLLWVVPLALYLLTFVVAFSLPRQWLAASVHAVLPYLVITIAILLFFRGEIPGPAGYAVHLLALFACALACHLRLAASRPSAAHLTEFYVWLSIGGALGGVFNAIVAPNVFRSVLEYPIALVAATALSRDAIPRWRWADFATPLALAIVLVVAVSVAMDAGRTPSRLTLGLIVGVGSIAAFAARGRPLRFALAVGAILVAGSRLVASDGVTRLADRSFYGVYRVVDDSLSDTRKFYSGTTMHGAARIADTTPEPLTYHRDGPLGALFATRDWRTTPWRVGIIGLGTGAAASYSRPGESWTFHEIDPLVARVAQDTLLFRFLSSARTRPRVVLGDARLSIARELSERFDVLVIDAFTSDAIPVHLLTREALALYRSRLAPDGVIAWHISNQYLDLRPVLEALAADAGMLALICDDATIAPQSRGWFPSTWVVMTAERKTAEAIGRNVRWVRLASGRRRTLWTDDFSNVLGVIR